MNSISDVDETRRQFLLYLLSTGSLASIPGCSSTVQSTPGIPKELPPGRSIFELDGDVRVNNKPATLQTLIRLGDVVETGEDSYVIFVVNKDAFILRSSGTMSFPEPVPSPTVTPTAFNLDKGKALSVLASRKTRIVTPNAVVGIRGTGVYLETQPDLSYLCTCYGVADLAPADNPGITETIEATHHDEQRYILTDPNIQNRIQPAPFVNHDDQELLLIETLAGRTPPCSVPKTVTRTRPQYR
ncbi:MAG TPA: hypothetical protein DCM54_11905 [Gammaproteobacteria bacterium]|nr:hypothetical protein [Gammaproteobacteria bacterium]